MRTSGIIAVYFTSHLVALLLGYYGGYNRGWSDGHDRAMTRTMTRDDVECDWPSRTIRIKSGHYTPSLAWDICGWPLEGAGTIYIDGGGSIIKVLKEPAR